MLTIQQLENNQKKFQEINTKYGIFTSELQEFLGQDFFTAPATTTIDMYGCYPGGLLSHCLNACKYAVNANTLLPDNIRIDVPSIIRTIFLSQIGKVFLFKPNENEWQRKTLGKMYDFADTVVSMRVGERSIFYATKHGTSLTEEEYQAILNSDKESDDKMAKYHSGVLSHIIKIGFELSILEEKHGKK